MKAIKKTAALLLAILLTLSLFACTADNSDKTASTSTLPTATAVTEVATEAQSDVLEWVSAGGYNLKEDEPVKNIILMIGDGMGENIIKNAEIVKGEKLAMSYMPHSCYVGTDSLSGTTDSAAASTAISCGIKTRNQYIGVDENGDAVETIVEFAKAKDMQTGLVATQIVPHATPAGMIAHENYRGLYNSIFRQMLSAEVDILFGGGTEYADTPKMQKRIAENDYTYIKTAEELQALNGSEERVLGCFSYQDFTSNVNPSLTTMTQKALEHFEKNTEDEGFFLMVEASHIDIFESKLDMDRTMVEMQAFDKCIDYVLRWAENHPGTLVLVTADHETGGVTVPESGKAEDVNNSCFTSDGEHTGADVKLFSAGAQAGSLITGEKIENTDIAKLMRKALNDTYGENEIEILNVD
ncbi:MAG: alkaline phosphatase [Ruminococcus sp.]